MLYYFHLDPGENMCNKAMYGDKKQMSSMACYYLVRRD